MFRKRVLATAGVAGVAAGLLAAAPADAGSSWGGPQEVSSKFTQRITLSDDGRVAAWIRTNSSEWQALGPTRTSWYKSAKKGWLPSAAVPGGSGTTALQLSGDGNRLLMQIGTTGYSMAVRSTKNTWGSAQPIATGTALGSGQMSGDGRTLVYVDYTSLNTPLTPGKLYYVTQNADGTWPAPTQLSTASGYGNYMYTPELAISKDGSTLVWVDSTYALVGSTRNPDGTWGAPVIIKQYAMDPGLAALQLSANGSRVVWASEGSEGVLTATRSGAAWSVVSNVNVDLVESVAMSPDGMTVAWGNEDDQTMLISRWNGTRWAKPKVLGSINYAPNIALANKTVAWTYSGNGGSALRSAIYKGGKWQSVVKHSSSAFSPAVSYDSRTLAWAQWGNKRTYSVKR